MDNIKVAIRVRPLSHSTDEGQTAIEIRRPVQHHNETETSLCDNISTSESASLSDTSSVSSSVTRGSNCDLKPYITVMDSTIPYGFDIILDQFSTQEETFKQCASHLCLTALEGFNASIFAYGQTGAGKTHTIKGKGKGDAQGILPRSLEYIFQNIEFKGGKLLPYGCDNGKSQTQKLSCLDPQNSGNRSAVGGMSRSPGRPNCPFFMLDKNGTYDPETVYYKLSCTYLEIYQEQIYDLLAENGCDSGMSLLIREDQNKGVYVEGLKEVSICSAKEALDVFNKGEENSRVSSTKMNKASSRSHAVFTINIHSKNGAKVHSSAFHIVDLAGSERQKATEAAGERLKEAAKINGSLSVFSRVISTLAKAGEKKGDFVHYRDSKLTYLLKDAIGGNSKTVIVGAVSPAEMCVHETVSTLKFCKRAKHVKTRAILNERVEDTIEELRKENLRLKKLLQSTTFNNINSNNNNNNVNNVTCVSNTGDCIPSSAQQDLQNADVEQLKHSIAALETALLSQSQYQALHCEELHHKNKQLKSMLAENGCKIKLTEEAAFTDTRRGRFCIANASPSTDCATPSAASEPQNRNNSSNNNNNNSFNGNNNNNAISASPIFSVKNLDPKLSRSMSLCSDMLEDADLQFVAVRPNKKDNSPAVRVARTKPVSQKPPRMRPNIPRTPSNNNNNNRNCDDPVILLPPRHAGRVSVVGSETPDRKSAKQNSTAKRSFEKEKSKTRPFAQKSEKGCASPQMQTKGVNKSQDSRILQEEIFHLRQLCHALRTHLKYKEPLESLPIAHIKEIQALKPDSTLSSALSFVEQQNMLVEWLEGKLEKQNSLPDNSNNNKNDTILKQGQNNTEVDTTITSNEMTGLNNSASETEPNCEKEEQQSEAVVYRKVHAESFEERTITCGARLEHNNSNNNTCIDDMNIFDEAQPRLHRRCSLPLFGVMNIPRRLASYLASTKKLFSKSSQPITSQSMIVF